MKLYEFEGQRILKKVGIESPFFVVCSDLDEVKQARKRLKFPIVAKVQVLSGRRGKSGGIKICTTQKQLIAFCKSQFGREFLGEQIRFILLSQKIEIEREHYLSITYDTVRRTPSLLFCLQGGMEIEEIKRTTPDAIKRLYIDPLVGPREKELTRILGAKGGLSDFIMRFWDAFSRFGCRLVEVNPLAYTSSGDYVAIDAKIILDDASFLRNRDLNILPKGAISAIPSDREVAAKKIDEEDYRGSAGSTFIELDGSPRGEAGDIAILASGGGASLLVMDSVIEAGGRPANYTEYSGNPPAEKVEKLTKITLGREGLSGCLVAGAVANFTDIYETLSGFIAGLGQIKPRPTYPIVIRRGGPRQPEAYEMIKKVAEKEGYDIHLFGPQTPISVACREMVRLSNEFKNTKAYFLKEKQNSKIKNTNQN